MDNPLTETLQFTPEEQANNARLLADLPAVADIPERERIVDYEIVEMAALLREDLLSPRRLTSLEILYAYMDRIFLLNGPVETYAHNGYYNAFVRTVHLDELTTQATAADMWLQTPNDERGPAPPLCGIPLGIKDSIAIKGLPSKNGTHAFDTNQALQDATCVAKLRAQGAVLVGHTICSDYSGDVIGQFAVNAWDPERPPGGSSQGSAVAPAARLIAAALGEETAGSIIIPAAANGISAIKPSLGLVSGAGVMPLRTGWDVVGPMARSVRDASLILSIIAGSDPDNDPQTLSAPSIASKLPIKPCSDLLPLECLTIGIPQTDWIDLNVPPFDSYGVDHKAAFEKLKHDLESLGATVCEFEGLDLNVPVNAPYFSPFPLYEVKDENGTVVMPVNCILGTTFTNQFETSHWDAAREFARSLSNEEHRAELFLVYPESVQSYAGLIPVGVRVAAARIRLAQQRLYEQMMDRDKIDFMLVLPFGAHLGLRSDPTLDNQIPKRRRYYDAPNGLAWPMVTFPIGYGPEGAARPLPITAAFWGRRFSEPMLVQAAIDYQAKFPQHHSKAPDDPVFSGIPVTTQPLRAWEIPPECSTDPLIIMQGRYRT